MEYVELLEMKALALRDTAAVLRAAIAMLEASAQFAESSADTAREMLGDSDYWKSADNAIERACKAIAGDA